MAVTHLLPALLLFAFEPGAASSETTSAVSSAVATGSSGIWLFLQPLSQILLITIGLMAAFYVWAMAARLKHPQLAGKQIPDGAQLIVESMQSLEPRKTLYVVRVAQERMVIASTDAGIHPVATLEKIPDALYAEMLKAQAETASASISRTSPWAGIAVSANSSPLERFKASIQWLLQSRFGAQR
jgi:flagellar biogenesis protein FliO